MDKQFVVRLGDKDYVVWDGILAAAHERGLQSIETSLIQIPAEENGNTAIVKAKVTLKDGSFFEDYGDANPRNTNARIATALIRMASTRAKGRALRDSINVGQTMAEELPGDEDHTPARSNGGAPTPHAAARAREAVTAGTTAAGSTQGFEAEYTRGGVKYTRAKLLSGTRDLLAQAKALGVEHPTFPVDITPNASLFEFAAALKPRVDAAKAAAAAGAEVEA